MYLPFSSTFILDEKMETESFAQPVKFVDNMASDP